MHLFVQLLEGVGRFKQLGAVFDVLRLNVLTCRKVLQGTLGKTILPDLPPGTLLERTSPDRFNKRGFTQLRFTKRSDRGGAIPGARRVVRLGEPVGRGLPYDG